MQQIKISRSGAIEAHGAVVGRIVRDSEGWVWVDDTGRLHRPDRGHAWATSREAKVDALRSNGLHR